MRIRINPTRMQLLALRRRLALARRGHKLLKDKLDGLVQKFFKLKTDYEKLHQGIEPRLVLIFNRALFGSSIAPQSLIDELNKIEASASVDEKATSIMGVKAEEYTLVPAKPGKEFSNIAVPVEMLEAQEKFNKILPELLTLAGKSVSLKRMAEQIIETRRRVNALEYVLIPELERAAIGIKMKLSELELASQVTLLKIKDIVRAH